MAVASVVLLLMGGEIIARAAEPGPFSFLDKNPYLKGIGGLPQVHEPNFRGRWDGTWYAINSLGFRGPEVVPEKSPNEFRVICVGDSCTFGKAVTEGETYPRQLEALLAAELTDGRQPVVVNCGVNGYSGAQYLRMLQWRGLELKPDVVIVGYNLNDFPNVLKKIDDVVVKATPVRETVKRAVGGQRNLDRFNESALYRFVRALIRDMSRAKAWKESERFAKESSAEIKKAVAKASSEENMQELELQIASIKEVATAAGAKIAFLLFPYESQVYLETYDRTPIERIREICKRLEVPFVDLAEKFRRVAVETDPPRELYLFGDHYHPRPIGYQIVAENVMEVMRQEKWLDGK